MKTRNSRDVTEALARMVEATLATAESMAMKTRPPRKEIERQVGIAQIGLDWLRQDVDRVLLGERTKQALRLGSAKSWIDNEHEITP